MSRKISNSQVITLVNAMGSFNKIGRPVSTSLTYTIGKHTKTLHDHYNDFIEAEKTLVEQYGTKGEDGKVIWVTTINTDDSSKNIRNPEFTDEKAALYHKERNELLKQLVDVPDYQCKLSKIDDFAPAEFPFYEEFMNYFFYDDEQPQLNK